MASPLIVGVGPGTTDKLEAITECLKTSSCARRWPWHRVMFESGLPIELVDVRNVNWGHFDDDTGNWTGRYYLVLASSAWGIMRSVESRGIWPHRQPHH